MSAPTPTVEAESRDSWVLVPREITLEMQHAYFDVVDANLRRVSTDAAFGRYDSQKQAYRAMIAAAPSPATGGVETGKRAALRSLRTQADNAAYNAHQSGVTIDNAQLVRIFEGMVEQADAALACPPPTSEPVAWCNGAQFTSFKAYAEGWSASGLKVQPLYASPVPIAGPTLEEIARRVLPEAWAKGGSETQDSKTRRRAHSLKVAAEIRSLFVAGPEAWRDDVERRLHLLARDSHPPIDLTPFVEEVVDRHLAALTSPTPKAEPNLSVAPFAEGGIGDLMFKAANAYREEYVLSTEGDDHSPTPFEAELLEDFTAGLISDERFFGPVRTLLALFNGAGR